MNSTMATGAAAIAAAPNTTNKIIGTLLAVFSGIFIGVSFVFKKKGLLSSQQKNEGSAAGEGHAYLKSPLWWLGMILMIIGEICNLAAYAFTDALIVASLGAISVVVCAILSAIFLKEKLSFFGQIGCALCILGAIIIALNGPQEAGVTTILEFQKLFLSPGFLVYASIVIVTCLFLAFYVAKRYGSTNMFVYIAICSLIGGISVSCTQGLGASILTSIKGNNQFKNWFIYFLLGFVIITLLTEINYLNKALAIFNTSLVTPTYYVMFSSSTIIASVILFQGFNATVVEIITIVMGFLVTVSGVFLLQLSKVDPETIQINVIDGKSSILLAAGRAEIGNDVEKGLSTEDPGMDSVRGGFGTIGSIHRALSSSRSMRREKPFNPNDVSMKQRRNLQGNQGGIGELGGMVEPGLKITRTQLYDHPMPINSSDKISLYSNAPISPLPISLNSKHSIDEMNGGRPRAISFADVEGHDHRSSRIIPNSADITSSFSPLQNYHDPYATENYDRNLSIDTKLASSSNNHHEDTLDSGTKARYNIPNYKRSNSKEKDNDGETIRLVNRGEDSDEDDITYGRKMSKMESEPDL